MFLGYRQWIFYNLQMNDHDKNKDMELYEDNVKKSNTPDVPNTALISRMKFL
jgi:hypothetical protein